MKRISKSLNTRWLVFGALLCMAMVAHAATETNAIGGMDDAKKVVTSSKRDPFWPVGYVPEQVVADGQGVVNKPGKPKVNNNWSTAMKEVVINGVSSRSNNEFYAVINGSVKSVGDTVAVNHEGTTYTWAVDSIKPPGSVNLRRVSAR